MKLSYQEMSPIEKIRINGIYISEHPEYSDNRGIAWLAVSSNGYALQYLSDRLKKDREIVIKAVSHIGEALEFAPYFQDDNEITSLALEQDGSKLEFCSERIRGNKDIVKKAIINNAYAARYLSKELNDSIEIALFLVSLNKEKYIDKMSQKIQDAFYKKGELGLIELDRTEKKEKLELELPLKEKKKFKKI